MDEIHRLGFFFIAGGSVISAIIDSKKSNNSDVDIFCNGLSLNEFSIAIKKFQSKLIKHRIGHHMTFLNESIFTFVLFCKETDDDYTDYTIVRLQFIWTCKMSTVTETLLSFDLVAAQIAFKPYPVNHIYFTDACLYFLKTHKCIVYNAINYRIKKYEEKGINNFLFKSTKDLPVNCINKRNIINNRTDSKNFIKLQINDDHSFFLSRFSYFESPSGHNQFINKNIDKRNLLNKFISSI